MIRRFLASIARIAAPTHAQARQQASQPLGTLELVARFDHQVTGVTVAENGRVFVNFPRWTEDAPVSVAEVGRDGGVTPYPDARWNEWRNLRKDELSAHDRFVCVQSVVADGRGRLWVLDPAAPGQDRIVPGGPKLVGIDLASNQVVQTILFDENVAPQGSYLNDVRFSPDGRWGYITDSGAKGAIVVVDLPSGRARRALDGHASTQPEQGVVVHADGKPVRRPDGRGVEFAADGIALSPDGKHLYWQAIKGRTLYRIATEALHDSALADDAVAGQVERVGENGPSDGLWIDRRGRMYISAIEEDAIKVRDGDRVGILVQDAQLRWPDTFSQHPDGSLYVTASRIQDMATFKPDSPAQLPTSLFRLRLPS